VGVHVDDEEILVMTLPGLALGVLEERPRVEFLDGGSSVSMTWFPFSRPRGAALRSFGS